MQALQCAKCVCALVLLLMMTVSSRTQTLSFDHSEKWYEELSEVRSAMLIANARLSAQPYDELLESGSITYPDLQAEILVLKAQLITEVRDLEDGSDLADKGQYYRDLDEALNSYDQAILKSEGGWKDKRRLQRYQLLKEVAFDMENELDRGVLELFQAEYEYLREIGMRNERFGFGVGASFYYGVHAWYGIQLSAMSALQPTTNFVKPFVNDYFSDNDWYGFPVAINFLCLGLERAPSAGLTNFSMNLVELGSPLLLRPLELGFQFEDGNGYSFMYYRPAIGLGWGPFSVAYARNFVFSRADRAAADRHMISIEFNYAATNRYRPKRYLK